MKPIRGHGLLNEGTGYSPRLSGPDIVRRWQILPHDFSGVGVCRCGATSAPLPSDAARKRWHKEHKQAILENR